MKRVLKFTMMFAVLALLMSCSGGSSDKKEEATETQSEITTAAEVSQAELRKTYIEKLKGPLDQTYPDHYEIVENEEDIYINVWGDGVALEAAEVKKSPTDEGMQKWEDMKGNIETLSNALQGLANDIGYTETIYLNVVNDLSKEHALLVYCNGKCLFDALKS